MHDMDSDSFETADEDEDSKENNKDISIAKKELSEKQIPQLNSEQLDKNQNQEKPKEIINLLKTVDFEEKFEKIDKFDKLKKELNVLEASIDASFTAKVVKEIENSLQEGINIEAPDIPITLKVQEISNTSCDSQPSIECHCKTISDNSIDEIKSTTLSGSWESTIENENDFPITDKNSETISSVEKNLSVGSDKTNSLNDESIPSKNESLQISPSGMLEMTSVLDTQNAEPKYGSSGWSTWASSLLNTAATSKVAAASLLNTAATSGSNWRTLMADSSTASGSTWGTTLLNTASNSVSRVKSQIGGGLQTVLQKVECSFGVVPPDNLATTIEKEDKISEEVINEDENKIIEAIILTEEKLQLEEKLKDFDATNHELDKNLVDGTNYKISNKRLDNSLREVIHEELQISESSRLSTVSSTIESIASSKIIIDNLDALEIIDNKTMAIIQESDTRLTNSAIITRKMKMSELLREAKKKAEEVNSSTSVMEPRKKINFVTYFEEYNGLSSLEALELLSKNCEAKVVSILAHSDGVRAKAEMEARIIAIINIFRSDECDDDSSDDSNEDTAEVVTDRLKTLGDALLFSRLDAVYVKGEKLTTNWKNLQSEFVLRKIIEHHTESTKLLAEITARAIELYRKVGDLSLLPQKQSSLEISRCLTDFTEMVTFKINYFAAKFSEFHQYDYDKVGFEHTEMISEFITNIFSEATSSCSYIQTAFRLLIPVMQFLLATNAIESS